MVSWIFHVADMKERGAERRLGPGLLRCVFHVTGNFGTDVLDKMACRDRFRLDVDKSAGERTRQHERRKEIISFL